MNIIDPGDFEQIPWKNGLGFTKQVAISDDAAPYWRMSIADVVANSQFSIFPDLHRVLTVIEGNGMDLLSEDRVFAADYEKPVSFPGEIPIKSQLRQGPIKDFNLIYDATTLNAEVIVVKNAKEHDVKPALVAAVYVLGGEVNTGLNHKVTTGSLLMASNEAIKVSLATAAKLLVIRLTT